MEWEFGEVRILALGASMMDGYLDSDSRAESPPSRVAELLRKQLPNTTVTVVPIAVPGITTADLLAIFNTEKSRIPPCDVALILCGTNDIGQKRKPRDIFKSLSQLFEEVHQHSPACNIIATSLPGAAFTDKELVASRDSVNTILRRCVATRVSVLDLHALVPFDRVTPRWSRWRPSPSMWHDDGLHLSPHGYRRLGDAYYDHMCERRLVPGLPRISSV